MYIINKTRNTKPTSLHAFTVESWRKSLRWYNMGTSPPIVHLLSGHIRPADGASGKLHVPDERFDGCLAHQSHKEELRD